MPIGAYSLVTAAAGPYTSTVVFNTPVGISGTYNFGLTQDGYYVGYSTMSERLEGTDRYGRTLIETFHQGIRMSVNCVFHEWRATELAAITPNLPVTPTGASKWSIGTIGSLGTDFALSLVLTALANTPAAQNGFTSITFPILKMRSENDIAMLFGPQHRVVPFVADAFPVADGTTVGGGYLAISG